MTPFPAERRAAMIHGRRDVRTASAARESRVRALGGNPDARVNAAWDAWFLKQLVTADLDPVTELGDDAARGTGGQRRPRDPHLADRLRRGRQAAGVDELRAGPGMDHRHGYRHDVRGGLMTFSAPVLDAPAAEALAWLAAARASGRP